MQQPAFKPGRSFLPPLACGAMVILFLVLSISAIRNKSATYDEPFHAVASWMQFRFDDFRMNYEDPPLTHYLSALPHSSDALNVNFFDARWINGASDPYTTWEFAADTLYRTPGNDGVKFIQISRMMMVT